MEVGRVHAFMKDVQKAQRGERWHHDAFGGKHQAPLTSEEGNLYNDILRMPMLEVLRVTVLVKYPWMAESVWEDYENVYDYNSDQGMLGIRIGGFDLDGDWAVIETTTYPAGVWFKFVASSEGTMDNPYFVEPVGANEEEN